MAEFEISGFQYRSGRLNAFQQFHVARKLGPVFAKLGPAAADALAKNPDPELVDMLAPLIDALAAMSEEDCNYVLYRCLSVVQRFQGGNVWAAIWNEPSKRLMFEDIDLAAMIQISVQVLSDNLGNFMIAPSSNSRQSPPAPSTPENLSPFPARTTG